MDKTIVRKEEDANFRDSTQNETDQHRGSVEIVDDKPFKLQVIREFSSQKGNAEKGSWTVFYFLMSENSRDAVEKSLEVVLRAQIFMSNESIIHFIEENFNLIFLVAVLSLRPHERSYSVLTMRQDGHANLNQNTEKERDQHQSSPDAKFASFALGAIDALCRPKISEQDVRWMVYFVLRSENRKKGESVYRFRLFCTKQSMIKFIEENLGLLLEAQISHLCRPLIYYGRLIVVDEKLGSMTWDSPEYKCKEVLGQKLASEVLIEVINGEGYYDGMQIF